MIQYEWEVAHITNRHFRAPIIFISRILICKNYCGVTWTSRTEDKGILILCSWSFLPYGVRALVQSPHLSLAITWLGRTFTFFSFFLLCSVTQSCLTFGDSMDCSTPGFPVLHHLLELAQNYVHLVNDTTQPTCPLLSPSPPAFDLSQHQGIF